MSSTELTTLTQAEIDELARMGGADPEAERGPRIPLIKVNTDDEDDDGNELPRGYMYLTEQDEPVYAKTIRIRPLAQHYQYSEYSPSENKMLCRTVENTSFQQEFCDTRGTVRCGRPGGKEWKGLDDDAKEKYKNITAFRLVRCLVSYEGKTKDGTDVTVENVPALLRLKGANFMPFDEEITKQMPKGRKLWDFWSEVSLEKLKNGSVTYYVMHFKPDFNNPAPLDMDTVETFKYFVTLVEASNRKVMEDYKAAIRDRDSDAGTYDAIGGDGNLEDDLAD